MVGAYDTARPEEGMEVVPEMRSATEKACAMLGAQASVVDLDGDSGVGGEEAVGSDGGAAVSIWPNCLCALQEYSNPPIAPPTRANFLGI